MPSKKRPPKPSAVPPAAEGEVDLPEPAPEVKPAKKTAPKPIRAGGYIDRGDGRGWVLDKE